MVFALSSCSNEQGGPTSEDAKPPPPREVTREVTQEVTQTVTVAEAPEEDKEEAASTPAPTPASPREEPPAEEAATQEGAPEEVLALQYRLINAGDYEGAYALFAAESKLLITPEQYAAYFEANAPYSITDYSFLSVDNRGDEATVEAAVTASSASGQESYQASQPLVRQGAVWRVVMRDEQASTFAGAEQETAQYDEPGSETAPDGAAPAGETTCAVGQVCDLGVSSVTVTSVQQTPVVSTSLDTFEGNFVVVEFDYTYGGNAPVDTDEPPFQLADQDGNTYSLNFEATSSYGIENDRSLIYTTVQPGVTAPGTAIFEVAPDAAGFTLLVEDLVEPQANQSARIPL
ncbi:MAG: DUF4352 domain-containing protein [Actinomycetota bacterium]|nr:DUF4352 domain-containing protein [Actinomycetota bacterium]